MDRPLIGVVALALGVPYLAMIALTALGGIDPSFLSGLITTSVVGGFVVAAVFEIKRLADSDNPQPSDQEEIIRQERLAESKAKVYEAPERPLEAVKAGTATPTAEQLAA